MNGSDLDHAQDPAGLRTLRPVRREEIEVRGGTQARHVDLLVGQPGKNQLIAVCSGNVEPQRGTVDGARGDATATARKPRDREPSVDQVPFVARGGKCVNDVATDLVTAHTDARPDRRDEICRPRRELARHGRDEGARSACGRPAPSRMRGANRSGPAIGQEKRHTIRGTNDECHIGIVGDQQVGRGTALRPRPSFADDDDLATVNLGQCDQIVRPHADRLRDLMPFSPRRQLEVTGGKQMGCHLVQRGTSERRSPGLMHPLERIGYRW